MEEPLHEDLATLSELDEKSLLESLSQRFKQDKIYVSKMLNCLCMCSYALVCRLYLLHWVCYTFFRNVKCQSRHVLQSLVE